MSTLAPELDDSERGYDPAAPLVASGNLRRRALVSRAVESSARLAAFVAVAVLGVVVWSVAHKGGSAISWDFLTKKPPAFGTDGGGIGPAVIGTAEIVAISTAIAMPIGILVALYLTEFAGARLARLVRLALDLINGLPSIVLGLFVFGLLVVGHHQSAFAGSLALSVIMVPLIARGAQEVLLLIPNSLREAADALGVSKRRSVLGVVLPAATGGILTATVLAIARAAGETAPLLMLDSIYNNDFHFNPLQPIANIPTTIFQLSEQPDPSGYAKAWGAGFVLLGFIMCANLAGRAALARSRKKLTQ